MDITPIPKPLSSPRPTKTKGPSAWPKWWGISLGGHLLILAALIYLGVAKLGPHQFYIVQLTDAGRSVKSAAMAKLHQNIKSPVFPKVKAKNTNTPNTSTNISSSPSSSSSSSSSSSFLSSMVQRDLQQASAAIAYPLAARMAHEEGTVNLSIEILPYGRVGQIKVLPQTTAAPILVKAAVEGLAKMQIATWPLDKASWFSHQVIFKLREAQR